MLDAIIKLIRWARDGLGAVLRWMLGFSLPLFPICRIQLSLHSSFLLLVAYFAWTGWTDATGGWRGLGTNVALLLVFFTCVVLHELGHALTGRRFGVEVSRILLMPIGGMAEFSRIPRRPLHEALMTLAGPAVNFAIAGLLGLALGRPSFHDVGAAVESEQAIGVAGFFERLVFSNLLMGCFNFLPIFPMDGGRILRAGLATRLSYVRATFWAAAVGQTLAGLLSAASLGAVVYFTCQGEEQMDLVPFYLWMVLFAFIFMAARLENRAVARQEVEAEHWRQTFIRLHRERTAE